MSDDSGEKTQDPSEESLLRARRKGEVAQSRDLTGAASLLATVLVLQFAVPAAAQRFVEITSQAWTTTAARDASWSTIASAARSFTGDAALLALPTLLAVFVVALAASFLQVGPLLAGEPLVPTLDKLNPLSQWKQKFASQAAYLDLLKAALKFALVAVICGWIVRGDFPRIIAAARLSLTQSMRLAFELSCRLVLLVALAYLVIGAADLLYQRWKFIQDRRTTREEQKREQDEQEGKQEHKAARRRVQEELALGVMFDAVADADSIVSNPTHIACAVRYDPKREGAPRLVAKGQGWIAQRIMEIARQRNIPIVRNVRLARSLHELKLDTTIPPALFEAVAEVLRWVEEQTVARGGQTRWQTRRRD